MNRRLSGKRLTAALLLLAVTTVGIGCTESIPGNPKRIVEEYVKAVQTNDFEKIYDLNFLTARQKIYLGAIEKGEGESRLKENFRKFKKQYDEFMPQDVIGYQWEEKHFFTPNAAIEVKDARFPPGAAGDPVNAEYEKDQNVFVTVLVVYKDKSEAPLLYGKRVSEAKYDCILKKIRHPGTVRVYSHDDRWYIGGCLMDRKDTKVVNGGL